MSEPESTPAVRTTGLHKKPPVAHLDADGVVVDDCDPHGSTTTSRQAFPSSRSAHPAQHCSTSPERRASTTSITRTSTASPHCSAALCETAPPCAPEHCAPDPLGNRASQHSTHCSTASHNNPQPWWITEMLVPANNHLDEPHAHVDHQYVAIAYGRVYGQHLFPLPRHKAASSGVD